MEPEPVPLLWVLGLGVPLALLLGSATRWVTRGELLVVTRRGVIVRSYGPGPAVRVPLLEHVRRVPSGPEELLLAVRVATADDADARVLLAADVEAVAPPAGRPFVDPRRAVATALGDQVTAAARRVGAGDLADAVADDLGGLAARTDLVVRDSGARVGDVTLDEVELILAPGAAPRTAARGPR